MENLAQTFQNAKQLPLMRFCRVTKRQIKGQFYIKFTILCYVTVNLTNKPKM